VKVDLHYGKSLLSLLIKVHDFLQQKELSHADFDFMTTLTKGQIEKRIRQNVIQLSLFDENISEIILKDGKQYLLKRNPVRAKVISDNRRSK
jgi:hypothetical protein